MTKLHVILSDYQDELQEGRVYHESGKLVEIAGKLEIHTCERVTAPGLPSRGYYIKPKLPKLLRIKRIPLMYSEETAYVSREHYDRMIEFIDKFDEWRSCPVIEESSRLREELKICRDSFRLIPQ